MQKLLLHPKKQDKEFQIIGINLTIKELTTFIISHVEQRHQKNHLQRNSESDDSLISLQAG